MDVTEMKMPELRKELKARGLGAQGGKAELAERLRRALEEEALDRELGLAEPEPDLEPEPEPAEPEPAETVEPAKPAQRRIVLNRTPVTAPEPRPELPPAAPASAPAAAAPAPARLVADSKTRLELRAKRFGLPPTKEALKEARRSRFATSPSITSQTISNLSETTGATLDVLKKRAERFGTSVSKVMTDIENKERLEKRKEKFGTIKT